MVFNLLLVEERLDLIRNGPIYWNGRIQKKRMGLEITA